MRLECPECNHALEFSGDRPSFCAYCGHAIPQPALEATVDWQPETPPMMPPAPASEAAAIPERIGGYHLIRPLGTGGMGAVYEAEDSRSGRRVALKLISTEHASSKEAVERFRQEGRLASAISHPRCVFVLAADEEAGRPYIVMERMPGDTLSDLVKLGGPLLPERAVHKILDVIDGLEQAHQLGVIHRDIKPSNCFLESNGRVKIGDFGLAKSLDGDARLTRTGVQPGTPLFMSPEQVKGESVDERSDIYAVAATLYFLVTGQAPFQAKDSMAVLARIVSEEAPSTRSLRPAISQALDKVILRGLMRDPKRRWQNLGEFRKALLALLPVQPSIADAGLRYVAWIIDGVILNALGWLVGSLVDLASWAKLIVAPAPIQFGMGVLLGIATNMAYFALLEGKWGSTPGKWLVRLRVCRPHNVQAPGVMRALLRVSILLVLTNLFWLALLISALDFFSNLQEFTIAHATEALLGSPMHLLFPLFAGLAGYVLLFSTARKRNGYRYFHEMLSGTRTVRMPRLRPTRGRFAQKSVPPLEVSAPAGFPGHVGPYRIQGMVHESEREQVLSATDPTLGRNIWLWLRPGTEPLFDPIQREVSRASRLRWLACGASDGKQWDAFAAPSGSPLSRFVQGKKHLWADARMVLEQLADELVVACKEESLPGCLELDQVWLTGNGQILLVGIPVQSSISAPCADSDNARALSLLRQVATLLLEGQPRPADAPTEPIRSAMPLHAARMINRLLGLPQSARDPSWLSQKVWDLPRKGQIQPPYEHVEELQADLLATQDKRTEVTRGQRAEHLAVQGLMICVGNGFIFVLTVAAFAHLFPWALLIAIGSLILLAPAYLARGGISFSATRLYIVGADGQRASRLRCVWRALLAWATLGLLLALPIGLAALLDISGLEQHLDRVWIVRIELGIFALLAILVAGYLGMLIWSPTRAPHDRIAGTYIVPK